MIKEEWWQAITRNDPTYDGMFLYAVKTTGIFCKPSCKSRTPIKGNVRIFLNAEQALTAQFRPCKRCKPTNQKLPDQEWVDQITRFIGANYTKKLTLEVLADQCHGSPFHLQRTFKQVKGITPVQYIQLSRITKAKEYLIQTDQSVAEIAMSVGIPNTPYFITLFKEITGSTPKAYREKNTHQPGTEGRQNESEI
ncbi:bifunctional transcriptional activator/DNA repair enzyme AdaA [Ammoniphilus sp. CFH 90114]|uniref:bifunctional transcriptional activator/DNA repair enzyme AdaA n=1 Tax=Ammoniphilus sp. CFH 90114 TaxID=2493665 RepID=UPI00100F72E9|nr:bifunctional transcriptional activator/DNA repair enzyme AdaA [Ammoniphilus sp. CFH 90114]RXT02808.1 methylphosphotriester-DNA--protein-cysteine methyltransferase family protein [Ammoniphilus sp. CFH 90114]